MKKCLLICASFYPAFKSGGPVRSATNLVELLNEEVLFDVITADRDMGDETSFPTVSVNSWDNLYGKANVFYIAPTYSLIRNFNKVFKNNDYDVIYLNSFFDSKFSIRFLLLALFGLLKKKSILMAPRGELTHGAMSLKPIKKLLYLNLFKILRLHKYITFHFTSNEEKNDALSFLGDVKFKLAPNMHGNFPKYQKKEKEKGFLNIIFLSRVSPKKNLLLIIESLRLVKVGNINFTIAGTIDDKGYWNKCLGLIKVLPKNIRINVLGAIDRKQVNVELAKSHLFYLPTLNENYGHAIVEAMMYSNIVMLSDQTPWSKVLEHGGFIGKTNDISYYSDSIKYILDMNEYEFNKQTRNVHNFCSSILENNISQIKTMFK